MMRNFNEHPVIRARAPLRLGLAGGGTDVSPFSERYGGKVLNATIDLYAHCTIEATDDGQIEFQAQDMQETFLCQSTMTLPLDGKLDLLKGVYNRIVKDYTHRPLSLRLTSYIDAPSGSGLGGSSTMVVAIIKAFVEWLHLPLGEYEIAHLAYEIERVDVGLQGGKQDQYAAAFGGFNFMEFHDNDKVIVNPLRVKNWIVNELEESMVIYFTGISRHGASIISEQITNMKEHKEHRLEAMRKIRQSAVEMKEALLLGNFGNIAKILNQSWKDKKHTAHSISNSHMDEIIAAAKAAGARAGKVSGAGGGGFLMFIIDPLRRLEVFSALAKFGGSPRGVLFTQTGTQGWRV